MNKQKWLTNRLSGKWLDKDDLIEIVLLECLRHFVEEEKGLVNPAEMVEEIERGFLSVDQVAVLQQRYDDLSSAYKYIVTKYDNIEEEYNQDYDSVREFSQMIDRQAEERDAAIEKIWRHRKKMWV
jgi:hypothetical protein